jgi:hypothetical protein
MFVTGSAQADNVRIEILGEVEYNQVNFGAFAAVGPGDPALIQFCIDSDVYADSPTYPTRGYVINQPTFTLTLGPVTVGLQDPFPTGETPYFVVRDNDPAVDGFFMSRSVDWPTGVPVNEPAQLDPFFTSTFEVSYDGATLSSLDILDALGVYGYAGIGSFYFTVNDSWAEPIGMIFTQLTISVGPSPTDNTTWGEVKALFR